LLFASGRARADGANSDRYTAPAAPEDLLWSERASPPVEKLRPFARVSASFADDPLVLENQNGSREVALIDEQFGFHFSVGAAIGGRVVASLLLPVYVQSTSSVAGFAQPDEGGIGNPGVDARFAVLNRESPVELALAATLRVPIGNSETLAADDSFSVWPRALVTVPFSRRTYLNLGLGPLLRGSEEVGDLELGSELRSVGGVHVGLTDVFGLTAEATATTLFDDFFGSRKTPIEAMGGARFESGAWVAGAGAGAGLNSGYGSPDFRALASLAFQALPVEPPPQAKQAPIDTDHDGIADARDRCANDAEDFDQYQDDDGCPDLDNDHDQIADAKDACPGEAEDVDGYQDDDGCPDPDNDGDKLADLQDRCPDRAEDFDQYQDDDGCPEGDNDQDGLADAQDQCPNEAETKNGVEDEDGCPDLLRVEVGQIRTLEPIFFEYNRGKIQRRSEPLLIELAQLIVARPDLGVISIEGHTDSQGSDKYNQKLSQSRADAVRTFLIGAGVHEARLTAAGYGESRPLFDNDSTGGRAKNRRVEFRFDPLDPEKSGGVATTKDPAP
jgi:outer membrane protein OmpA-like peptidoglycan-associated protein